MLVYNRADANSIKRAVAKAKQIKPRARVIGYGRFLVAGSKAGQRYEVRFSFNSQAELVVECGCQAGSKGAICYHSASVAMLFRGQWAAKRAGAEAA